MNKILALIIALSLSTSVALADPIKPTPRQLTQEETQREALRQLKELVGDLRKSDQEAQPTQPSSPADRGSSPSNANSARGNR